MHITFNGSASSASREHHIAVPQNEDESSAHIPFVQSGPLSPGLASEHDMSKDKERPRLEILPDKECIFLKGTGVDVEPARLSGHIALYLSESTSIKEITLQFRGKARLPVPTHESIHLNSAPLTYIVCNHEWSFLEGEKRHSHTLKAGRHFFPFQLQLGGSLPSSVSTSVFGGASVAYKLRAHVSRPGLSHNLQSHIPVTIVRSFAPEALEYQQTLEIENTWPEKLMYSIMIPHKAWACGDTLTALVKFSPLLKGVGVLNINTSIHETTKVYSRSGHQEHSRVVASVKHEIAGGKAVAVHEPELRSHIAQTPGASSLPGTPSLSSNHRSSGSVGSYFAFSPYGNQSSEPGSSSLPASASTSSSSSSSQLVRDPIDGIEISQDDVVTYLTLPLPFTVSPTHVLDPIHITHRIRWSILILNPDGHTSELRCSLPLHLLDSRLLDEARLNTAATRRLLIGGPKVPAEETEDDMELPSYTAHVRDRVANMYLPESATMRVTNPWVRDGISPINDVVSPWPGSRSGHSSPLETHALSHLPHAPGSGDSTPLDWVNSELLLSLHTEEDQNSNGRSYHNPPSSEATPDRSNPSSNPTSRPGSRPTSVHPSRRSSRASSPERGGQLDPQSLHVAGPNETYIHSGNACRNVQGVFKATMKPFTSLTHPTWLSSRSHSHTNLTSLTSPSSTSNPHYDRIHSPGQPMTPGGRPIQLSDYNNNHDMLHRAFTEVPDYQVASRGFIGGVPPLTSMRGLPSYEDSQLGTRTRSENDLATSFAHVSLSSPGHSVTVPNTPQL